LEITTRLKVSSLFGKTQRAEQRIIIHQGGTTSSKTFTILQLLLITAIQEQGVLISVVSESLPHLKRGAMRDLIKILSEAELYSEKTHNKSDNSFTFGKSKIEFFGADQPDKLRGARRDYLFINECNNVSKEVFNQLEVRTLKKIYMDFNPVSEFWVHTDLLPLTNVYLIKSTYRDNPFAPKEIIRSIERRKETDPNWYKVYGLGEIGTHEGLIFLNFNIVNSFPDNYKWLGFGLDFGYANDPTSFIKCCLSIGELFFEEIVYETALTNDDIHKRITGKLTKEEIVADSADPKSIEDLRRRGWNIKGAYKGKDSILKGIDLLKQYKINITSQSTNLIKEFRNYSWKLDKATNKYINEPVDNYNHGIDAIRYFVTDKITKREIIIY
jgi:phage terminase large subunit